MRTTIINNNSIKMTNKFMENNLKDRSTLNLKDHSK